MTMHLNADKRTYKSAIGFARESIRLEDLAEAQIKFIKDNWDNEYITLGQLCQGVVTYKGMIRIGDLKRIAVRLNLSKRPRVKRGEKLW